MASGFLVNSTEPASAKYSRERDSAKRITSDKNHAIAINTSAITMAAAPPPPFLLPPDDEPPERQRVPRAELRRDPKHELAGKRNHARDDDGHDHQLHIAVADVREFVRQTPPQAPDRRAHSSSPRVTAILYCFSFMPDA